MYDQNELDMLAQNAKKELEAQAKGEVRSNDDLYADIMNEVNGSAGGGYLDSKPDPEPQSQQQMQEEESYNDYVDEERFNKPAPDLAAYDETLFPGGPTKSQINSWKKEWEDYDIFVTQILNKMFVFRTLNRFEYKQLVSFTDIDALVREETICQTVTLWPSGYNYKDMAVAKAGIPSTYSEIIMEKSGFTKDYAIEEL